ncbi:MAG: integrase arm-type DNA-binding domain-containing protein [Alphaproteobacteria bacterium]|nr:integrase arm-type DNA-binding domain-containing protein [Alphaproteobacteria bacterium]
MAERFMFDAAGIEALAPGDRERRVWDEALKGFGVRVRPSGTKSWIVNASTTGSDGKVRSRRVTLGQCGEMSLEEARTEARKLLGAGIGAAAVDGLPAAGAVDGAPRGRGEAGNGLAPQPGTDGHAVPGAPKSAAAAVETDADRPAGDPVAGLEKKLDGIRGGVDRIEAWSARTNAQMELLSSAVAVSAVDRRRRRLVVTVLAAAVLAPVFFAAGAAVENRRPFMPLPDPTLGWKDYIWEHYSSDFRTCFQQAKKAESGRVRCTMEVRAR